MKRTALALAALAGLAFACNRSTVDAKLDQTVMARLSKEPMLAQTDVHVRSDGNHVFLTGRVRTPDQRKLAAEVADDVYGVDRVTNDIQVDVAAPPPPAPTPQAAPPEPESMPPEEMPPSGPPAPDQAPENSR